MAAKLERRGIHIMRYFNITGLCVPEKHYMVDLSARVIQIAAMVDRGDYFTINRARQFGKTTTLTWLSRTLKDRYLAIKTSFEGLGDAAFETELSFCQAFIRLIETRLPHAGASTELLKTWIFEREHVNAMDLLSRRITTLCERIGRPVVLLVDEVDKSSNNQMFLHFLGLLRSKYLDQVEGSDVTFHSVILAGVYDVKNLKLKLRPDEERKYNSPWNIAADFRVDMRFNPVDIAGMLSEYDADHGVGMDIGVVSEAIYKFTSGYPFLVSKVCKILDEDIKGSWTPSGVEEAVARICMERNTLFDNLIKCLENNREFYEMMRVVTFDDTRIGYSMMDPVIEYGEINGVIRNMDGNAVVDNLIFEEIIHSHFVAAKSLHEATRFPGYQAPFISGGRLDMERILERFQALMKTEYRDRDIKFLEREGRLLFLCFLKPIINGKGFYYVEPQTRQDMRMDLVVSYGGVQSIVELKIWRGEQYYADALAQLARYLDSVGETTGYLVVFRPGKKVSEHEGWVEAHGKRIFTITIQK